MNPPADARRHPAAGRARGLYDYSRTTFALGPGDLDWRPRLCHADVETRLATLDLEWRKSKAKKPSEY